MNFNVWALFDLTEELIAATVNGIKIAFVLAIWVGFFALWIGFFALIFSLIF